MLDFRVSLEDAESLPLDFLKCVKQRRRASDVFDLEWLAGRLNIKIIEFEPPYIAIGQPEKAPDDLIVVANEGTRTPVQRKMPGRNVTVAPTRVAENREVEARFAVRDPIMENHGQRWVG
jgi:hypothetical protein